MTPRLAHTGDKRRWSQTQSSVHVFQQLPTRRSTTNHSRAGGGGAREAWGRILAEKYGELFGNRCTGLRGAGYKIERGMKTLSKFTNSFVLFRAVVSILHDPLPHPRRANTLPNMQVSRLRIFTFTLGVHLPPAPAPHPLQQPTLNRVYRSPNSSERDADRQVALRVVFRYEDLFFKYFIRADTHHK